MTLRSTPAGRPGLGAAPEWTRRARLPVPGGGAAALRGGKNYFLTVTVADVVCETQPRFVASVTVRVKLPLVPAVKVILLVPWPAVMVPFWMLHEYLLPAWFATEAGRPVSLALAVDGAVIAGAARVRP